MPTDLARLQAQAPYGCWSCDARGGIVDVNEAFLRLMGADREACLGEAWIGAVAEEDREPTLSRWRRCVVLAVPWEHVFTVRTPMGGIRHVLSRGGPVLGTDGEVAGWTGVSLDVTAMKESEEELRQSQERFRAAMESGCDLLYECDPAGGVRRWFGPVDDLLGHPRDSLPRTEEAWEAVLHPDDRAGVLDLRRRHFAGEAPFQAEYRVVGRDGDLRHWLDRGKALRGSGGSPLIFMGVVTDITERKKAEEMIRRSEERRSASRRLEVVGRLAGGIAHDFNNLLTAVNGYSELLISRLGGENELTAQVREILAAGEKAALLTRQLLAFSRRQVLAPRMLDSNSMIRDLGPVFAGLLGPAVEVSLRPGSGLARIKADPSQFEQVLLNLVLNAKEAMPAGGRLTIETANVEGVPPEACAGEHPGEAGPAPGPYVLISVRDSGEGMDEETKERIFEPFFTTRRSSHHGLGLPAVHGIVRQSGGWIGVDSRPGQGTLLRIWWPAWAEPHKGTMGAGIPSERRTNPARAARERSAATVLLVEDEETARNLVREILEAENCSVIAACDGEEALEVSRPAPARIDLLLTDVVMPGMGGIDLAIRFQALSPGTRVLFMSGYGDHPLVREGIHAARREFIAKPFARDALVGKVREMLGLQSRPDPVSDPAVAA